MVELKIKKDNVSMTVMDKEDIEDLLDGKVDNEDAFSGSYNDLTDKPSIPSKTSDLTNDSGFLTSHQSLTNYVQKSQTNGLIKNDGTVDTSTYLTQHQDISSKANISDLATIATSGSYNDLTDKPTIPSASSTTPSADVSGGAVGSSSNYAKADHQHPLSSAYATSDHNHSGTYAPASHTQASSTITDMSTVEIVVTYTDSTSETLTLFKQVNSQ